MEMIDMYEANDLIYNKYEPIWDTLSEDVVFICETLAYFSWEKEVERNWFIGLAMDRREEYSNSIMKLKKKDISDLLKKVINQ